jgi:phosphonopyruvate decarboxylase
MSALLDRREAVPAIIGDHTDFKIITGLAGPAQDVAALTEEGPHAFMLGGAMGGAAMVGLGLALARPEHKVLVVTGDGELLMSLGSLATIGAQRPHNLAILCIDNQRYGETGNQPSHTAMSTDLCGVAAACGFPVSIAVADEGGIAAGRAALRGGGPALVVLKVGDGPSRRYGRNWDATERKLIFRAQLGPKQPGPTQPGPGRASDRGADRA